MIQDYEFIKKMPKTELHLHIEGTLEASTAYNLLLKQKKIIPNQKSFEIKIKNQVHQIYELSQLENLYNFDSLMTFLELYSQLSCVLEQKDDFEILAQQYVKKMIEDHVVHVEIFFDPQTHTSRGVSFEDMVIGLQQGFDKGRSQGIDIQLICCFLRDKRIGTIYEQFQNVGNDPSAWQTAQQLLQYNKKFVDQNERKVQGVGIDNNEVGYPPSLFTEIFEYIRKEGNLFCVAHAGEESKSLYIWEAIHNLKIVRIDHGIQCLNDKQLVEFLKSKQVEKQILQFFGEAHQIPLTCCPCSNLKLQVFKNANQFNYLQMLDNGIMVTINSDDPAFFKGYTTDNYYILIESLSNTERGITLQDIKQLCLNGFMASNLSSDKKKLWIGIVEKYFDV